MQARSRTTVVDWNLGELIEFVDSGIEHCRAGRWEKGADYLGYVAARVDGGLKDASLFYSYLGCAIARVQKKHEEAQALCRHAVKVEFYQPENWANLAEVQLLSGRRKEAVEALQQGLRLDPQHERLTELREKLGQRRRPVLGFLDRSNPLNRVLGRLRAEVQGSHRLSASS